MLPCIGYTIVNHIVSYTVIIDKFIDANIIIIAGKCDADVRVPLPYAFTIHITIHIFHCFGNPQYL